MANIEYGCHILSCLVKKRLTHLQSLLREIEEIAPNVVGCSDYLLRGLCVCRFLLKVSWQTKLAWNRRLKT